MRRVLVDRLINSVSTSCAPAIPVHSSAGATRFARVGRLTDCILDTSDRVECERSKLRRAGRGIAIKSDMRGGAFRRGVTGERPLLRARALHSIPSAHQRFYLPTSQAVGRSGVLHTPISPSICEWVADLCTTPHFPHLACLRALHLWSSLVAKHFQLRKTDN